MAKSDAERARNYRRRQAVKTISEQMFGGLMVMTLSDFFEGVEQAYDDNTFHEGIVDLGEETLEHTEERNEVWSEAYEQAFKEAYAEIYEEIYQELLAENEEGVEENEDLEEELRQLAHERAKETAEEQAIDPAAEAVKEWEESLEDYSSERVTYALEDLIEAYREAHSPLFD